MHDTLDSHIEHSAAQDNENNGEAKLQEWKDKVLRISAEFENYKKRQERDREQFDYFAQRKIILPLLNIIDNLERFKKQTVQIPTELKEWAHGIELVMKDFEKYFVTIGLERIDQSGISFDPVVHEAVMQVEHQTDSGKVVQVLEPGYRFKNNIVRPAKVSVAT